MRTIPPWFLFFLSEKISQPLSLWVDSICYLFFFTPTVAKISLDLTTRLICKALQPPCGRDSNFVRQSDPRVQTVRPGGSLGFLFLQQPCRTSSQSHHLEKTNGPKKNETRGCFEVTRTAAYFVIYSFLLLFFSNPFGRPLFRERKTKLVVSRGSFQSVLLHQAAVLRGGRFYS